MLNTAAGRSREAVAGVLATLLLLSGGVRAEPAVTVVVANRAEVVPVVAPTEPAVHDVIVDTPHDAGIVVPTQRSIEIAPDTLEPAPAPPAESTSSPVVVPPPAAATAEPTPPPTAAEILAPPTAVPEPVTESPPPPAAEPGPIVEATPTAAPLPVAKPPRDPATWGTIHGSLQTRTVTLPGPVVVQELQWRLGDPELAVRTDTAVPNGGRATVQSAAANHGAIAAVNGGFWLDDDDPDGWLLTDGRLRSDTTGGRYWKRNLRGGFGLTADGRAVIGVPTWDASVTVGDERRVVRGVARRPIGTGDVILFPHGTWTHPPVPAEGLFLRVPMPDRLDITQQVTLPVLQSATTPPRLDDPNTMVVWFDAEAARGIGSDPNELTLTTTTADQWAGHAQGLVAGPWILEHGIATGASQWRSEGFSAAHTDRRHPRSAFGFTPDGMGVIAVVDGRDPAHSIGLTAAEMAGYLADRGVHDAVLLDGGASSQLVVDGRLVNRPCCESSTRRVATVLVFVPR